MHNPWKKTIPVSFSISSMETIRLVGNGSNCIFKLLKKYLIQIQNCIFEGELTNAKL